MKYFKGFMHDIGRGAYLKPRYFIEAMCLAAQSGYTHFIPYLENMIRLPSMEKACPSAAYSAEDWRGFDRVAGQAGIELVPHFNVIGHSVDICKAYPELAGPNGGDELDPTSETARTWLIRCLDEYCLFASGTHFLIGGDEWQTPNHVLAKANVYPGKIWVDQINRAAAHLHKRGRIPIIWHDMLCHYPGVWKRLARNIMVAVWYYDVDSDYPILSMLKQSGFQVIMATGIPGIGQLSRRRVRALACARDAVSRHQSDGIMVTSWNDCRWEKHSMNIPLTGRLLDDKPVPEPIINAVSLYDTLLRITPDHPVSLKLKAQLETLIHDPAWHEFPEYHEWFAAKLSGDVNWESISYLRFHAPEGPIFNGIRTKAVAPVSTTQPEEKPTDTSDGILFGLVTDEGEKEGPILRVCNGEESFTLYPKYGASLQDWRIGNESVIPHSLPDFLQKHHALPGGYRSYSSVGGFRPIWAFGIQHNPCILWQYPWAYKVREHSDQRIIVEFTRSFPHADITYRIEVERGRSGFVFTARAKPRMACWGTFNWNLPLAFNADDLESLQFNWMENGQPCQTSIPVLQDSAFWLNARDELRVDTGRWRLQIVTPSETSAGYFVDWCARAPYSFMTPDLHGAFHKVNAKKPMEVTWRFSLSAAG